MANVQVIPEDPTAYLTERCGDCGNPRRLHMDVLTALGHGGIPGVCRKYTWDGKSGPYATKKEESA